MRFSLFWRLTLFLLLFYAYLRGQFLFWNFDLFRDENFSNLAKAFWVAVPFDLVAIAWTLAPVVIWGWFVRGLYWIPFFLIQIPLWVINAIDTEMWNFWGRRMTFSSVSTLMEGQGKAGEIAGAYGPWALVAFFLGLIFWFFAAGIFRRQAKRAFNWKSKRVWIEQILILVLLVVGTRGGFQKKPISPVNADHFAKSQMNQLSLNTTFMLLKSYRKTSLAKENYFASIEQAEKRVNGGVKSEPLLPVMPQQSNVVIIILESFSSEYKTYTPFLNELKTRSLSFERAMASGRRSIEGVAAILAGIPALMEEPFITSEFSTNQFEGMGHVLSKKGYDTSFYHGGDNGTMHFDAFTAKAGFQHYFGSKEYPNQADHDGIWGIRDRPYLQYYANELAKKKEPFLSTLFTLSSHQPYKIPPGEEIFGRLKTEHPILNSIAYTDSALKDFFKTAETMPWYQNTLFILVADHTGPQVFTEFDDKVAAYRIPLLFFHPQVSIWPDGIDRGELAQHIDIPASVYDLLGVKDAQTVKLSRSVFRPGPRTFTAYFPGTYLHTDGVSVIVENNKKQSFIDFENYKKAEPENPQLQESLKAVKEVFSRGLWDNALYF